MPSPEDVVPGGQALEHQARSPAEQVNQGSAEPADQGSAQQTDHQSGAQLEPRQDVKSAQCELFPLNEYNRVVVDFWNWDPEKDGKPELFEKAL